MSKVQSQQLHRVAVVGAGLAGATCAWLLRQSGHAVQVFDKSRGPGGRLATRCHSWVDENGQARLARLDHGALGFSAHTPAFRAFAEQAVQAGWLSPWQPRLAPASLPLEDGDNLTAGAYLPVPEMPALCRHLLDGVDAQWSFAVDALQHSAQGWQVQAGEQRHGAVFDAVVLAIPPAQAAPLLSPHRSDWARHAAVTTMQPGWTLMGAADEPQPALNWDLLRPAEGPLAWLMRCDARPGRERLPGQALWVAHARAGWSRKHLEQTPGWAEQQLKAAVDDALGHTVSWRTCTVHRWRYALPSQHALNIDQPCWWDAARGLGVCGDFLGGHGVEGAWLSAQALAAACQASDVSFATAPRLALA